MGISLPGVSSRIDSIAASEYRLQNIVNQILEPISPFDTAPVVPTRVFTVYMQLGDMRYAIAGPIAGLDTQRQATWAQHTVIEGKPRLQSIGDELEQLTLTLELHSGYCDPVSELTRLKAAQDSHAALPLLFASGELRGRFVIDRLDETHHQHEGSGIPVHVSVRLTLLEWVEDQSIALAARKKRASAPAVAPGQRPTAKTKPAAVLRGGDPASVPTHVIIRGR